MSIFSKLAKSTDLVNGLAARLGADLGALVQNDSEMQTPKYRSMVLNCCNCSDQAACARLQDTFSELDTAPDYCRNHDFMNSVRRG